MPRAMPRPGPSATAREAALEEINIGELRIRAPPPSWTTTATVSSVLAWGALAVHNILALPKLDGVPPVSFERVRASGKFVPKAVLFVMRVGVFAFGVFFLVYHLMYEESRKHTDGMQYLSDWTLLFLCAVEGALGLNMYRTERVEGDLNRLTNVLVIGYGTAWAVNLVASGGAWYSFFAYPMCKTLEGVDNYPQCYLEWYRLSEHAGNLVVLVLELLCGGMPMRRRDFGWSILFMQAYVYWCWFRYFRAGGVATYDMFDFSKGMESLMWHNLVFFGTTAAFFIALKLHQSKGYRTAAGVRAAGPFIIARVADAEAEPLVSSSAT